MIEVYDISKTYGQKKVLSHVSFTAENGCVTGFVGPNGAGKSTTMRMIAHLETPDEGKTFVDGQDFSKASCPLTTMGVYLGSDYLPLNMTGQGYLEYVCQMGNIPKENIPYLLEAVELLGAENQKISAYSLGMKQRIGLAAAIAGNADTLMLDEPVNGLDPMGVQWLRSLIRGQAARGKAVLLSSHLLSELELVADKIVMLDRGYVTAQGRIDDLAKQAQGIKHVTLHTSDDERIARFLAKKNIEVKRGENGLSVPGIEPQKLARFVVKNDLDLYLLEEKHLTLEEMFMARAATHHVSATPPLQQAQAQPRQAQYPVQAQYPQQPQSVQYPQQQRYPVQAPPVQGVGRTQYSQQSQPYQHPFQQGGDRQSHQQMPSQQTQDQQQSPRQRGHMRITNIDAGEQGGNNGLR